MVVGVAGATVMLDVVGAMLAEVVLAVMVVEPLDTPVTGTVMLVAPVAKVIDAGTVTKPVGLAAKLIVNPAGAGADRSKVRLVEAVPMILTLVCTKLMVAATLTGWLADR